MSSGQACVLYGIAAFSKDGDWIIREDEKSCAAVIDVLEKHNAKYRLGAPLDVRWLSQGWSSHFEFMTNDEYRARTDFVSRAPRIDDIERLWQSAYCRDNIEMVDIQNLMLIKQTRRSRDYNVIGALAEACGSSGDNAECALRYLQDYTKLAEAVKKWPDEARRIERPAVKLLLRNAARHDVVSELAVERDSLIEQDEQRIQSYRDRAREYNRGFSALSRQWKQDNTRLSHQHRQLCTLALEILK